MPKNAIDGNLQRQWIKQGERKRKYAQEKTPCSRGQPCPYRPHHPPQQQPRFSRRRLHRNETKLISLTIRGVLTLSNGIFEARITIGVGPWFGVAGGAGRFLLRCRCAASGNRAQELLQVSFEFAALLLVKLGELKRLQAALGGPHRK